MWEGATEFDLEDCRVYLEDEGGTDEFLVLGEAGDGPSLDCFPCIAGDSDEAP